MSADVGYKTRVDSIMRGAGAGLVTRALLSILAFLYGFGVRIRLFFFRLGILRVFRLSVPVISIGNLTVGGTGKTPMAMFIARLSLDKGKKAVILSRGYKRASKGLKVVSDYNAVFYGPDEAGDEPYLMAMSLPGVPVIVCADRVKAGQAAIERFAPDLIILDDGFQHLRCFRDVNIALVDGVAGFGNGQLLPRGVLREPISVISRADIVMIKGKGIDDLKAQEQAYIRVTGLPIFGFEYEAIAITALYDEKKLPLDFIKGKAVAAVSGIANNRAFAETLEGLGARVDNIIDRPDHHSYDDKDIKEIALAARPVDMVVTTEKDAVKLKGLAGMDKLPVYVLRVAATISESAAFIKVLSEKTEGLF